MNRSIFGLSVLALVLAAGGVARADDGKPQPGEPALKGPKVPDRHVPGVENGLGTMQGGGDKRDVAREMPIPHQAFMRMLNEALGDQAAENLRLSSDQRSQIDKISQEFTAKQRDFAQANRAEVEKLVEKYGPDAREFVQRAMAARGGPGGGDAKRPGKDGKRPDAGEKGKEHGDGDEMKKEGGLSDDARAEITAKLKELHAAAPKQEDARTAIWGALRADQQAAVQKKVDAFKAEREKEMDERYKEREKRKLEERGNKKNPAPGAEPGKEKGEAKPLDAARRTELLNQLPDDLKARVGKMPEQMQNRILGRLSELSTNEQREEFYGKLRERMKNGEGEGRKPGKNK